ncbi:SLBB domain-containing protein [Methylobacterium sp. J-068]|uniref:SLBB domain-containing protein n=1 Tax=Methylobacterium sp. J-068 TaxID=2836649 RepID=UPI001FBBF8C5|nr:SLBB domain-containing protein [Methylobacterium sp. J-068]MCJ2035343.1 SLBB domain-containing protein [Methylobacterium sp. J-068]
MLRSRTAALLVVLSGLVARGLEARAEGGPVLRAGDRLKITFYETMELPNPAQGDKGPAAGAAAVIQTFYQRIDLSGDYAIEQGGTLSLPFFGFVPAAGKPLETLRTDLMGVFETAFGRHGGVTVGLLQRAPVFVVGSVRNPGAYPYTGGMIVLQAIALAGGRDKDPATLAGVVESLREREREETARARLKRALARRAALAAGRAGQAPGGALERLRALAGAEEASALVAAEAKVVRLETNLQAGEEGGRRAAAEASVSEVDLLRKRLETYGVQIAARGDRLRTMEALFSRQVVESERVADVRRDFVDMEGRRREYEVSVLQAELRQRLTREAVEQGSAQHRLAAEREVALVDAEIVAAERALATASVVGATMSAGWSRDPALAYRIVRSTQAGPQSLPAAETDTLEPGDVLKVVLEPGPGERGREGAGDAALRGADATPR